MFVLDSNFLTKVTEKPSNASLTEPLFETIQVRSRLDMSHENSVLPSSYE